MKDNIIRISLPILFLTFFLLGYKPLENLVTLAQADRLIRVLEIVYLPSITLTFLFLFRSEIRYFIKNLKFVKAGGVELSNQQPENNPEEKIQEESEGKIELSKENINRLASGYIDLKEANLDKEKQIKQLQELVEYSSIRAEFYEFIYLDGHLVHNTKLALAWIASLGTTTKDNYNLNFPLELSGLASYYKTNTDQLEEKAAILNALVSNFLVYFENESIRVTPKGQRYLRHVSNTLNK